MSPTCGHFRPWDQSCSQEPEMHLDSELCHKPPDNHWLGEWCSACWGWKGKEQLNSSLHLSTSPFFSLVAVLSASISPALLLPLPTPGGFPDSSAGGKESTAMWEAWVRSLGWEDPLKMGKATHSSILAWRSPWTVHGVAKSQTWLSNFKKKKSKRYYSTLKFQEPNIPVSCMKLASSNDWMTVFTVFLKYKHLEDRSYVELIFINPSHLE